MWLSLLSTRRVTKARAALTARARDQPSSNRLGIAVAQTGLNIYKLGTKQAHVASTLQSSSGLWGHGDEQGAQAQPVAEG